VFKIEKSVMSKRINFERNKKGLLIRIKAYRDSKKQKMLAFWIVMFTMCGAAIFSQFFYEYDNSTKLFFGVYIAFWMFFEFKVIYAYRWRTKGFEEIVLENDEIILSKVIGKRGVTQKYKISDVKDLKLYERNYKDFVQSMNTSYWNINKYSITFTVNDVLVPFGIDLNEKQASKIIREIEANLS